MYLLDGDGVSRGRLEYCRDENWYTLCADDWRITGEEARVVCETLGYDISRQGREYYHIIIVEYNILSIASTLVRYHRRGEKPILPISLQCNEGDHTLRDCSHNVMEVDVSLCTNVAEVVCNGEL